MLGTAWDGTPAAVLPTRQGSSGWTEHAFRFGTDCSTQRAPLATSCLLWDCETYRVAPLLPITKESGRARWRCRQRSCLGGRTIVAFGLVPFSRQRSLVARPAVRKRTGTLRTWPPTHSYKTRRFLWPKKLHKTSGTHATKQSPARELAVVNGARGTYSGHLSIQPRQRYTVSWEARLYIDFLQRFHLWPG